MRTWSFAVALTLLGAGVAAAQEVALEPEIVVDSDSEIDLANVVTSAAKGVTTIQEAPAIITIITADEIKARGFRWIEDAFATVPGWLTAPALGSQIPAAPLVRGVAQSALLLRDGVSMFDPFGNLPVYHNTIPLESVKRLEIVTGPGGVLWGANSFMGILNVIMKDAEDVHGLELDAGYGDGPGMRQDARAYAMLGKTFLGGKLKIFQHVSYESWIGPTWNIPNFVVSTPAPQPTGPAFFGPVGELGPDRSWMVILDGKYSFGPVSLTYNLPFADMHQETTFASAVVPGNNTVQLDRHVALAYKDRFWRDRIGLDVKGYWAQFVTMYNAQLFPPQAQFPAFSGALGSNAGGVHFLFNDQYRAMIQRTGLTLDSDFAFTSRVKVLLGGEFFYEGVSELNEVVQSAPYATPSMAMGANGAPVVTATPAGLPLLCPTRQNPDGGFTLVPQCPRRFVADQYRLVGAIYADLQVRPLPRLTLDAGIRAQMGFGGRPYDLTPLYSGAVVWNFLPDYHLKLNYTTGFRPPPFNDTDAVSGGIIYGANPSLKNETSQSFQGELNARLLRNAGKVRELLLRVDYSYTYLSNFIVIRGGSYNSSGSRGIHSVEAFGKLYLNGDHFLTASYTFLYAVSSDTGVLRNVPNHWVSLGGSFNLVRNLLDVNVNLLVTGAFEDINRYPSGSSPVPGATTSARTSDLTFERLTPVALLQLGFRLRFWNERLGFSGQFYNVLNQRYHGYDVFYDPTPSIELQANPAPGFSFFARASARF